MSGYFDFYQTVGTGQAIGAGGFNTQILVEVMMLHDYENKDQDGKRTSSFAARLCNSYRINGYDDWFLPSRDELNQIYEKIVKKGYSIGSYIKCWTSSEGPNTSSDNGYYAFAESIYIGGGLQSGALKYSKNTVWPIRAF